MAAEPKKQRVDEEFNPKVCARRLLESMRTGEAITERGPHFTPPDVASVYLVHEAIRADPVAGVLGGVVGYKMGGTGAALLPSGVKTPALPGMVLGPPPGSSPQWGVLPEGVRLSRSRCNYNNVEAEIGFRMRRTPEPASTCFPLTQEDVWAAVDEVFLAIEACGSRYALDAAAGAATALEKSADLQCAGAVVCGRSWKVGSAECPTPEALATLPTGISVKGVEVATGGAELCPLGSPLASLTWLANHLPSRGQCLRPGETIITGACSKTKAFGVGDSIVASFGALGTVRLTFDP